MVVLGNQLFSSFDGARGLAYHLSEDKTSK